MIILFGSMGEIAQVAQRSLERKGYGVSHVDFAQNTLRDEAGYRRELRKAVAGYCPGAVASCDGEGSGMADVYPLIVIPIGCPVAMARYAPQLESDFPGVKVVVENREKVELLDSKVRFYEYAQSLGLKLPYRYLSVDQVPEYGKVVFKSDSSFAGHGVRIPHSRDALRNHVSHNDRHPYLIQEYVEGEQYSCDVVRCMDGRCFASSYRVDPACSRTVEPMPELAAISTKIVEALDYHGVCGFDFIIDNKGTPYLLEANPRLTGGLRTQLDAGFDILSMLLR